MQCLTLALAFAGMIASTVATPTPELDLEVRGAVYPWHVSKFQVCKSDYGYDYSFNIEADKSYNPPAPGFTATCSGSASGDYADCQVTSHVGRYTPSVSADVTIIKENYAKIPELNVHLQWTNVQGITHLWDGQYNATVNCGTYQGRKFTIVPEPSLIG